MMLYLEDENFLSQKDKDFINNVILGNNFTFYYQTHSTKQGDHNSFFCHNLIRRLEDRIEGQDYRSLYDETASKFLLDRFFDLDENDDFQPKVQLDLSIQAELD